MRNFFKKMSTPALLVAALLLGMAPFVPEPHLLEKIRMLANGQSLSPLDLFDMLFHSSPLLLLLIKWLLSRASARLERSCQAEASVHISDQDSCKIREQMSG